LTNTSGTLLDHISYSAYGKVTGETNPSNGDRFKFTVREYESASGLYHYRARTYDAAIGRFISEDPIAFKAWDTNLYRYVGNHPCNSRDPLGLQVQGGDPLQGWLDHKKIMKAGKSNNVDRNHRMIETQQDAFEYSEKAAIAAGACAVDIADGPVPDTGVAAAAGGILAWFRRSRKVKQCGKVVGERLHVRRLRPPDHQKL
jgi:RHS repeat-associated protein